MSENPYSSPTAFIEAESLIARRPRTVQVAVCLLFLSVSAGFVHGLIQNGTPKDIDAWIILALTVIVFGLAIGIPSLLLWRLNWARWLNIVLSALSLSLTPWAIEESATDVEIILYSIQAVMDLSAVGLLLLPVSARWYRPNNSFKPRPLRGSAAW